MTLKDVQKVNHCGPCSMSYAMFMLLGRDVDQSKVVSAVYPITGYLRVLSNGMDPFALGKAAFKMGVATRYLDARPKDYERKFHRPLYAAVESGSPALLCVNCGDDTHWICIAGVDGKGGFIVCDPDDNGIFTPWSKSDVKEEILEDEDEPEKNGYFALVLSRLDGKPAAFKLSKPFMHLVENESYDDIEDMRSDLESLALRLGGSSVPLGRHLMKVRPRVIEALSRHIDWDSTELKLKDLDAFYDDYVIVAESAGLLTSRRIDDAVLAAEMAVILSTCAWWGGL